jgi:hypothetical protein
MANAIKYSESVVPLTLRKGDFYLLTGNEIFGTTSATGFWNGYDLTNVKYVIYLNRPSNGPSIYAPANDNELIAITNKIANTNYSTASECIAWFATQSDKMVVNKTYPPIVTNGLVLNLDAGFLPSYPTSGTTWYDLSGNNNSGSLINGPTFNPVGAIEFDGINDYINIPGNTTNNFQPTNSFTINAIFKPIGIGSPTLVTDNTSVILGSGITAGSYGIGLNYNQIAGTYNLRIGCRSTDNTFLTVDYAITLNTIYNVSLTYQTNGTQYIYVNGVQISSASTVAFSSKSLTPSTTYGFNIFRNYPVYGGNGRYGIGYFYKGLIYNKALSQTEILQNYYQAPIVTDGLVLSVDASNIVSYESGSTTAYPLTSSVNGTLINGTSFNPNFGGYWVFDGIDDYITWGDNFDLTTTNISGFVWGWANSLNSFLPWIDKLGGNGNYRFHADGVGRLIFGIRNTANTYEQMITTNLITTNTWYYLGFTFNNSTKEGKIYLNGQLQLSNTFTIDRGDTFTPLQTGYQANNLGTLNGRVATLSLYNKQLSDQEVSQNFNAQRSRFGI